MGPIIVIFSLGAFLFFFLGVGLTIRMAKPVSFIVVLLFASICIFFGARWSYNLGVGQLRTSKPDKNSLYQIMSLERIGSQSSTKHIAILQKEKEIYVDKGGKEFSFIITKEGSPKAYLLDLNDNSFESLNVKALTTKERVQQVIKEKNFDVSISN